MSDSGTRRALPAIGLVGTGLAVYGAAQALHLRRARAAARARLAAHPVRTVALGHGGVAYVDCGPACDGDGPGRERADETILSVHGLYGGYDQALNNVGSLSAHFRIIAPSRFGYPGSAVRGDGSPADQAAVFAELLDRLGIERVFVLGASAGGTPAIRFALDHPDRVKGLILLSSAAPWPSRPATSPGRMGPPPIMNHDWLMWLLSPLFGPVLGMAPKTVNGMLPLSERRTGADIDVSITNRDMAVHFEDYPIEQLEPPVLVVHAQDDKMAPFAPPAGHVQSSMHRYPDLTTAIFSTGGHLIAGHGRQGEEGDPPLHRGARRLTPLSSWPRPTRDPAGTASRPEHHGAGACRRTGPRGHGEPAAPESPRPGDRRAIAKQAQSKRRNNARYDDGHDLALPRRRRRHRGPQARGPPGGFSDRGVAPR